MDVKLALREFITNQIADVNQHEQINDNISLIDCGIIDSLAIIKLIDYIEATFSIHISDDDLSPDNFDSLDTIAKLVTSKQILERAN